MSSIRDPRSSEGYKPRFELWGNVFLHQAYANVINSLSSFEVTTTSVEGVMTSEVRIPIDRLIWNVKILRAQIIDEWREKDEYVKLIDIDWKEEIDEENVDRYLHQIIQVLSKRAILKFRKPRSLGGPPSDT